MRALTAFTATLRRFPALTVCLSEFPRVALAGTDLTDRDFLDVLLNHKSSGPSTSEEWFQYEQMKEEKQEENIRKLQATVVAQGKLLKAIADRLNITE